MKKSSSLFKKAQSKTAPCWLMRQAGRYLPEYRSLRKSGKSFVEFCMTPELCIEATLQPLRRYPLDAAIIFSDILTIPFASGQAVSFEKKGGPQLGAFSLKDVEAFIQNAHPDCLETNCAPVYEAVKGVRANVSQEKSLIGFAGAPWTLAAYMLEGGSSKTFARALAFAQSHPDVFEKFLKALATLIGHHLLAQIRAGCDVVQIFDSWAGLVPVRHFMSWISAPTRQIVDFVKEHAPDVPVIGFPRGAGVYVLPYVRATGVDCISLDESVSLDWAHKNLPEEVVVQGAVSPLNLIAGGHSLSEDVGRTIEAFRGRPHILNLSHGVRPPTPPEHVAQMLRERDRLIQGGVPLSCA